MSRLTFGCQLLVGFVIAGSASAQLSGATPNEPFSSGGIEFRFATAEQGRQLLGRRDPFVDQMSPFDRQVRMRTRTDEGTDAYLRFASGEARDWPSEDRIKVRQAIELLDQPLSKIGLPQFGPVLLIHTSGREESDAAYTRGSAIILPASKTGSKSKPNHRLIAHELFHVLSRANPELRDRLYLQLGFRNVGPIPRPKNLADRCLTNPDAPLVEHVIRLKISEGTSVSVCPLLFSETAFDPDQKRSLFGYLKFQLMEVRGADENQPAPAVVDGKPVLHAPTIPDFHRQIGGNTRYIIHPEEILADNFVSLVTGAAVKDPWVIDAMRETFAAAQQ